MRHLFIGLVVSNVLLCIAGGVINFTAVPIFDTWSNVIFYARITDGDNSAWWEHHNEHLIFLTRLLFWIDFKYFRGSAIFLIVSNYGLMLASCSVFYRYLTERLANQQYAQDRFILFMLLVALLFSWVQRDNIIWTFQSQFFLATLLPLAAFYYLHKASENNKQSGFYFAMACLFGILALGSMANGVMVLPLLTLLAMLLRMGCRRIVCLLTLTLIGNYLYFLDYQMPIMRGSLLDTLLQHPLELAHYLILYLGSPLYFLTGGSYLISAELAGIGLIGCSILLTYRELKAPNRDSLVLALLTFILYVGGTALGTGGGRLAFGVTQALTSRYTTPILQAWAALLVLFAPTIVVLMRRYAWRCLAVLLGLQLFQLTQQTAALKTSPQQFFDYKVAMLAATMQVKDQQLMHGVFAAPELLLLLARNPTTNRLAFLNTPVLRDVKYWQQQIDTGRAADICQGSLDGAMHLQYDAEHLRIKGWLFNQDKKRVPESIRILNQQRQVIGYALVGMQREDLKRLIAGGAEFSGFQGYVTSRQMGQEVILKGMAADCEVSVLLPNVAAVIKNEDMGYSPAVQNIAMPNSQICDANNLVFNEGGTVTDKLERLQWALCNDGLQGDSCQYGKLEKYTYQQALEQIKRVNVQHGFAGKNAWRLPSIRELLALERKRCVFEGSGMGFPDAPTSQYWSDSLSNYYGYYAWDVLFLQSYERWLTEYYQRKILLVRSII